MGIFSQQAPFLLGFTFLQYCPGATLDRAGLHDWEAGKTLIKSSHYFFQIYFTCFAYWVFMKDFNNIVRHKFLAGTELTFFE